MAQINKPGSPHRARFNPQAPILRGLCRMNARKRGPTNDIASPFFGKPLKSSQILSFFRSEPLVSCKILCPWALKRRATGRILSSWSAADADQPRYPGLQPGEFQFQPKETL